MRRGEDDGDQDIEIPRRICCKSWYVVCVCCLTLQGVAHNVKHWFVGSRLDYLQAIVIVGISGPQRWSQEMT